MIYNVWHLFLKMNGHMSIICHFPFTFLKDNYPFRNGVSSKEKNLLLREHILSFNRGAPVALWN